MKRFTVTLKWSAGNGGSFTWSGEAEGWLEALVTAMVQVTQDHGGKRLHFTDFTLAEA